MPTIIELVTHPISLVIFALYGGMLTWESLAPGRPLPSVRGWRLRSLVAFALYFLLSSYLPLLWEPYLAPYQLFDLSGLGVWAGAAVGLLVYELGAYVWHRSMHRFTPLWLGVHQMHHSAERMDIAGAYYFSPLDMIGWTALASVCLTLVVGLDPMAVTVVLLSVTLLAMFQHTNVRTPRWLGYLVQRPESHTVHHGRGVHARNYADLPIFDLIFDTFENPAGYERETGFYDGASERVLEMLLARDVSTPPQPRASRPTPVQAENA